MERMYIVDLIFFRIFIIVVVRVELIMVYKNMVKLRVMFMIKEVIRVIKNDKEEFCYL